MATFKSIGLGRTIGAGVNLLSPTDVQISVVTIDGVVNIILPSISDILATRSKIGNLSAIQFFITDISNKASTNNIIVTAFNRENINGQASVILNTDGVSVILSPTSDNCWNMELNDFNIPIPKPIIKIGQNNSTYQMSNIFATYLPTTNSNYFLNYNPKYYLFVLRKSKRHKKKVNGVQTKTRRKGGWVHPTNENGVGYEHSKYYGGTTETPITSEFNFNANPYIQSLISLNPFQFAKYNTGSGLQYMTSVSQFGLTIENYVLPQDVGKAKTRGIQFAIAIGIKNPNKNSKYPILFGDLSSPFRLTFSLGGGGAGGIVTGFNIYLQSPSMKRNNV